MAIVLGRQQGKGEVDAAMDWQLEQTIILTTSLLPGLISWKRPIWKKEVMYGSRSPFQRESCHIMSALCREPMLIKGRLNTTDTPIMTQRTDLNHCSSAWINQHLYNDNMLQMRGKSLVLHGILLPRVGHDIRARLFSRKKNRVETGCRVFTKPTSLPPAWEHSYDIWWYLTFSHSTPV